MHSASLAAEINKLTNGDKKMKKQNNTIVIATAMLAIALSGCGGLSGSKQQDWKPVIEQSDTLELENRSDDNGNFSLADDEGNIIVADDEGNAKGRVQITIGRFPSFGNPNL